jgi:hypothetical protein
MSFLRVRVACQSVFLAALLLLWAVSAQAAAAWSAPVSALARKIADATGPGAVALEVNNKSSLSSAKVASIRNALRAELASLGIRLVDADQAAATANVTLSENVREYVWAAEIQQGTNPKVAILISTPRTDSPVTQNSASVQIRKQFLWSQEDRILDAAMLEGSQRMVILDSTKLTLYKMEGSRWQHEQDWPVQHAKPWPRDLRGRLVPRKDHLLDVYLPGVFCRIPQRSPMLLECFDRDEPWPVGDVDSNLRASFNTTRNYFAGALLPGVGKFTSTPSFYSGAAFPREKYTLWLFTGTDGTVHAVDGLSDQAWRGLAWGSDIVSVHTGCESGWQVLADVNRDASAKDSTADDLRLYDVADREAVAVSSPLNLPGRVTALWNSGENEAVVVIQNETEGRYEAYRLLFACGN